MGGRGASSGGGGAGGGIGGGAGGFTVTQNANGTATITPAAQNTQPQNLAGAGSGISDVNSHTTYFTPGDYAILSNSPTDGYGISPRTGMRVPVGYYQTGYYANVNGELRDLADNKRTSLTPKTQKVVDAMDRNMRPLNDSINTTRWVDETGLAANLGIPGASRRQIISALSNQDITRVKNDYTSSSWDAKASGVAGQAGRYVRVDMHYAKGALAQFSPTKRESEMVGARNTPQRFSNARIERGLVQNARTGRNTMQDILVVDCYVD